MLDNIVIGEPIEGITLKELGVGKEETTVRITLLEAAEMQYFLPRILVSTGLFKTTSEIKRLNKDRLNSKKIKDPLSKNLWRTLDRPEFTHFKIGRKDFYLIVGDINL